LHDVTNPEAYGGLPKDPRVPWTVRLWKGPLKWLGNAAMIGGLIGLFAHYLRVGPKAREDEDITMVPHEGKQP
ncbi:MAG TPA: formate dehydrogenase N subunit beta transmembrane domain-containing protein, partial [Candidatus Bathyarchaeia archaeon]|nr:formate dehydrogenase N subunit beta transmembrane domain-containing protein [Candidatus Bathyarchaeia archaeon]